MFGPNDEAAFATDAMISMQDCWPEIRRRVTFHLVYPTSHRADLSGARGKLTYRSCDHLRAMIHDYGSDDSANYKVRLSNYFTPPVLNKSSSLSNFKRILMEHNQTKNSYNSKIKTDFICSV